MMHNPRTALTFGILGFVMGAAGLVMSVIAIALK